jgi:hypothetical protein
VTRRWFAAVAALLVIFVLVTVVLQRRSREFRDPAFAEFLDGVRERTPPDATISLVLPAESKAYVSEAVSRLAPRRVFVGRENEAKFVAAYRYQYRDGLSPDVMKVPNGALFRRQVLPAK